MITHPPKQLYEARLKAILYWQKIKIAIHRIDHLMHALMGETAAERIGFIVPPDLSPNEIKKIYITSFVSGQPSLGQVVLFKIYVTVRHAAGTVAKKLIRVVRK